MTTLTDLTDLIETAMDDVHDMDVTHRDYANAAADAVLAMIKPLKFEAHTYSKAYSSGNYLVQHEYDASGNGAWAFGFDHDLISDHETAEYAKDAANAHHRAQILAALGLDAGEGQI